MRREIELWAPWMSEDDADLLIDEIERMPVGQRKPTGATLAERLLVTYAERDRLRLQTIRCYDISETAMALMRKRKKRLRDRRHRLSRGAKTRAEYLANNTISKEQPWLRLGISRRTYYYRIKQEPGCTGPRQVSLSIKTELALVQSEGLGSKAGLCDRVSTATHPWQTDTCADGFLTAGEAAWLVDAVCPDNVPGLEAA